MVLMILLMFFEDMLISSIARSMFFMYPSPAEAFSRASSARLLAVSAFCAFRFVWEAISSRDAVSSSMALACSVAPWERAMLEFDTSPAPEVT